ncbi:MAG TPA: hypothetical protein VNY24_09100 [Candidatus Acidoferrales bacterium]|jgi:hypothetical protein|nr:hypothetical protein [Candidatus Acidoferrales bacterium]
MCLRRLPSLLLLFAMIAFVPPGGAAAQKTKDSGRLDEQFGSRLFLRHVHSTTGASWKDASDVHFDEWLD